MSRTQGRPLAMACAALALAVPMSEAYVRATARPAPLERWNRFSADVTISRGIRRDSPQADSATPAVTYRWQRSRAGARWKTTMSVVRGGRADAISPSGQAQAIPLAIARIEDDGDGAGLRLYDRQGVMVRPPDAHDRWKMGVSDSVFARTDALSRQPAALGVDGMASDVSGDAWVEAVLPSVDQKNARRSALQRRFGRALGRLRGLDRYVQTRADATTEILTDDQSLPVEVNVVRGGALESHSTFAYGAGPGGSLLRRRAHSEHVAPNAGSARMILDVELANVTLEGRR